MKKVMKIALFALLVIPTLLIAGGRAEAAGEENVDFILHKIVFPDGQLPEDLPNIGDTTGEHADLLKEYRGLNDVTFAAYDVSEEFYQLRKEGQSVEDAQNILSNMSEDKLEASAATAVTQTVAGEEGTAQFQLPAKDFQNRDAVYLFHEAKAPSVVKEKAKNMVVVLPVYLSENQPLTTIHLYPKNEEIPHEKPSFKKEVIGKNASYEFGDIIPFEVTTEIPLDILDYKKFVIMDDSDSALHYQKDSLKLTQEGNELSGMYNVSTRANGFTIDFTDIKALGAFAGKTVTVSYEMQLVAEVLKTDLFTNIAKLDTDHETIERKVEVETGGMKFKKVDLKEQTTGLKNAEFHVLNNKDQLLTKTEAGYAWTEDSADNQLVTLVSDSQGAFEINGLAYGEYSLQEVKAPAGYQLSNQPVTFTVSADSYQKSGDLPLKVVNLQTEVPPTDPSEPNEPNEPNKPKTPDTGKKPKQPKTHRTARYPKTNDTVNHSMIWLGAILIAVVVVILWQNNKKAGKKEK
ncbi:SpaH/EbpB family LPXTG-anchored major pilin [Candidatus Enterococcus leclercqii]|uniref:SpaH/EbpB family LPXTG-anchored major pilin n=1 Tax=Candidatus Enterococcus leclercqii TaxID=1857218 RepID=UPI00137AD5EF|nr:SpaH/EbpB family LPXTG-anchored major pilin [Enterococcus sp. CU9D]KAF1291096.1 hypothetical protein BAU14_10945 [Enterococcus sp. CU9D]